MGFGNGILKLVGVLPIERPDFSKRKSAENLYENKIEQLNEFNKQYVWIFDFHEGVIAGDLFYQTCMGDSYILDNCSQTGNPKILKVHDLQTIF